jgi:membrane protease YdiL (CAAX protease family)
MCDAQVNPILRDARRAMPVPLDPSCPVRTEESTRHLASGVASGDAATESHKLWGNPTVIAFAKKHPVLTYYAVAFAISWGGILVVVGPGGFLTTTSTSSTFALAGFASILGPSLAGVLLTSLVDGRAGWRDLLLRLRRWRVGARWYAVALLTAPLVTILTLLALSLGSPAFAPAISTAEDKASLLMSGIAVGLIVPVFEELGWTGFAMPRLRLRHGILATGLIMGGLWGAWHFPLFAGSAGSSGEVPPALFMAAMLFAWILPYRVLIVWVYDRTQSLLLAMLMHMPIVVGALVLNPEAASGEQMFMYLIANGAGLWLVVGAVALANGWHITQDRGRAARQAVPA